MLKKGAFILLLLAIACAGCKKKITKYPFEMAGIWYAPKAFACGGLLLVIETDGKGRLLGFNNSYCMVTDVDLEGKMKYKNGVIYIKNKKFEIRDAPVVLPGDSVDAPLKDDLSGTSTVRQKASAKMTLQEKGIFTVEDPHIFFKYVDY